MSFIEQRLDGGLIVYDTVGGPEYSTDVVVVQSGYEKRNVNWAASRGRWELGERRIRRSELETIIAFFRAVKGRAYGFRWKDWADYQATTTTGRLGTLGQGTGLPSYQLYKRYALGSLTEDRAIKKPVSGTVTVYRNGGAVTFGSSPGQVSLDVTTGLVTFVADGQKAIQSITVGTTTQVTFSAPVGGLLAGQKLYLGPVAGPDAALLANQAHLISSVSGTGPVTYTLAVNTAGKSITPGGASGYKYPQAEDVLTWAGEFDVPVRFDTDILRTRFEAMQGDESLHYLYSLPIVEIRL
ncbi:MAG: DUF2460 domain-containing protein [Pseudomonadota bacterium]